MQYPNLLEQNIYSSKFKGKFLLTGSCVPDLYPQIIKKFEKKCKNVVSFLLLVHFSTCQSSDWQ